MLKKTFIITQFGTPHAWTQEFIDNVQHLEKDGWYWKVFTPNKLESKGNVEIVPMTTDQFNDLCEQKLGVRPNLYMTEKGVPSVHMTDFYTAGGVLFDDYLKDSDYWGIANIDMVFGNLSKFLPDSELEKYDVWTDDPKSFNGIFSLFRNGYTANGLFKRVKHWDSKLEIAPCPKCTGTGGNHTLWGTDEYDMTEVLRVANIKIGRPKYYPLHSHDRLEQHVPEVKLELKEDGSLYELFKDINGPQWIHAHPYIGHEIPYFHFLKTKKWPLCLKK